MVRSLLPVLILTLAPAPAYAYFDPGAGVVMLQVLIAAGLGVLYRFRALLGSLWRAVTKLFRR